MIDLSLVNGGSAINPSAGEGKEQRLQQCTHGYLQGSAKFMLEMNEL
jgi:hypothetical protein